MSSNRIINVHTHIRTKQDIDARVKLWRECGCVKVCVLAITYGSGYYDNEGVRGWMKKHPDIILGFAAPDLGWKVAKPETIEEFKEQGFAGLKFISPSYAYDDERYFPLYERAEQLNMPILFHTGFLSSDDDDRQRGISMEKLRAMRLDPIARYFPKLRIMMGHLGNPEFHVGLDMIHSFSNVYGEFSGASGSKFRETVLRKLFAPLPGINMKDPEENLAPTYFKKLCFGTDNPEPPRWIELDQRIMTELELPEEIQEQFWWKSAAKWLGIEIQ